MSPALPWSWAAVRVFALLGALALPAAWASGPPAPPQPAAVCPAPPGPVQTCPPPVPGPLAGPSCGCCACCAPCPAPASASTGGSAAGSGSAGGGGSELLAAILGALIGLSSVWLTDTVQRRRAAEVERVRREVAVQMLRSEIAHNLDLLARDIAATEDPGAGYAVTKTDLLALMPCPDWSTTAWDQSLATAQQALEPALLLKTQQFYSNLRELAQVRRAFAQIEMRPEGATIGDLGTLRGRAWELADSVAKAGNPLAA